MASDFAVIIPARYQSSRFPGKPLAELRGADGEAVPLIVRTLRAAHDITDPASVWVATDDERIAEVVQSAGGQVLMTPAECRNGTERCAAAVQLWGDAPDIIVNLQGDAPLTPAFMVGELVEALRSRPEANVATPALRCSPGQYRHLAEDAAAGRVGGTTVLFDQDRRALYFSKRIIPYVAPGVADAHEQVHLHVGLYAYRREALRWYAGAEPASFEESEGLEQLRFLAHGRQVVAVPFDPIGWDLIELNNPEDVPAIEEVLRQRAMP